LQGGEGQHVQLCNVMSSVVNCTDSMPFFLEKSGAIQYYRSAAAADDDDYIDDDDACSGSGSIYLGGADIRVMDQLLRSKSNPIPPPPLPRPKLSALHRHHHHSPTSIFIRFVDPMFKFVDDALAKGKTVPPFTLNPHPLEQFSTFHDNIL
jgi:hypothetical protein